MSDQVASDFGWSVAAAGDVNGDGFDDVIVGAIEYDHGEPSEGRAFLYQGSASGLATTFTWSAEGDESGAHFGVSVATAGDVNGDGFDDVIVGAPEYTNGQFDEGRAFLYLGSASGLGVTPAWTAEGEQSGAHFGTSAGTAGDLNGDGFDDVIVGAYAADDGQTDEGLAFAYLGSASGLGSIPAWTGEGDQAFAAFGWSVGTAGDVDGDGFDDVIVGARNYDDPEREEGKVFVYQGSAAGLGSAPSWTVQGDQGSAFLGWSVGTAGDVDGDGFDDVIVGAYHFHDPEPAEGAAFVYGGSPSGLSTTPLWSAQGDQDFAEFGFSVGTAGDVNGDGFDDVIIGAELYDHLELNEGRGFVYRGSRSGPVQDARTGESNQPGAQLGFSVGTAGDVDGDGFDDVIAGAPFYDEDGQSTGAAFAKFGSAST